jgi:CHRD domain-containing protein
MSLKAAAYKGYHLLRGLQVEPAPVADPAGPADLFADPNKHMSNRVKFNSLLVGMALLVICAGADAQKSETYKVRLSTVPVDAPMMSRVAGSGSLTAVLVGSKLTFNGSFQGLRSPATHASIHVGPKGIAGPPILDLMVSNATGGNVTGTLELTPPQLEELRNAKLYVQIDSEKAQEGNLWGWLLR